MVTQTNDLNKLDNVIVLFIRGLPGSGKSTLASLLQRRLNFKVLDPDQILISDDSFKLFLAQSPLNSRLKNIKYRYLLNTATDCINNNVSIIWNQPWRKVENIQLTSNNIHLNADDSIKSKLLFITIELTIDNVTSWNRSKAKYKSEHSFLEYVSKYKPFDLDMNYIKISENCDLNEVSTKISEIITNKTITRKKYHFTL